MKILILGGVAESKLLARKLIDHGHIVIYSLVGLVRQPDLPCEIHVGGFSHAGKSGAQGLSEYCAHHHIELLLDATHPYAVEISANAVQAAKQTAIPCWRFNRPGWNPADYPNWHSYNNWDDLFPQIIRYHRPFFSIGISALKFAEQRPPVRQQGQPGQQWIVRSARPFPETEGIIQIIAIGPFSYADERALMLEHKVDALISKNSGCSRVSRKLDAALDLNIPVFVQARPALVEVDQSFNEIDALVAAINHSANNNITLGIMRRTGS
ncbi:precorrin-6A/cobalt-precorrin-6A reductase [Candidatus Spongiihabitans sp.]|uniref:precorrin-6A/cobalt-precorrin-6A reductase n=1 Tax=Candidatus Spongiihabitans sp. TaxID=3101308 RepID=UPI003C6F1A7D